MIITTHQPIFLPWPGFFCKALRADVMVLLDEVQYPQGRGWMNRNRLKSEQGELWLTVPVRKTGLGRQSIRDVAICEQGDWRRRHLLGLRQSYEHAPYRDELLPAMEAVYAAGHRHLIDLNLGLIRCLWQVLGLETRLLLQSELGVSGGGSELLAAICHALGAECYLALSFVEKHLQTAAFAGRGIRLQYERFHSPVYPQLWGEFRYNLSALDLLLNCGPAKSRALLTPPSRTSQPPDHE